MGEASPENGFFDKNGEYGLTQHAFAIQVNSDIDGYKLEKALNTDDFKKLISLIKWAGFKIDYLAFKMLKDKFWEDFV